MNLNEYQQEAIKTDSSANEDVVSAQFFSIILGFGGEAGEVMEKFKKIYWHKNGAWDETDKQSISKELGDMLWYVATLAHHVGYSLEEIGKQNLEKIQSRIERGVHKGFGDDR